MNLKSTRYGINPKIPHINRRPRCEVKGCCEPKTITATKKDGGPIYRKVCSKHHRMKLMKKHKVKNLIEITVKRNGFKSVMEYRNDQAQKKGFDSHRDKLDAAARKKGFYNHSDYENSTHEYRQYRKDYCENRDGHLTGIKCNYVIQHPGQLTVDHFDGNPANNDPNNFTTYCDNCHKLKSIIFQDMQTPGRKTLGISR